LFGTAVTHQEAKDKCNALGAGLASIHSDAENNFIGGCLWHSFSRGNFYLYNPDLAKKSRPTEHHVYLWIGMVLHRKSKDGKPHGELVGASWTDGSPLDYGNPLTAPGKKPWAKDQPATGLETENHELCVQIYLPVSGGNPLWNDAPCESNSADTKYGYLCQKPAHH
jgi:hypothetical protein